MAHASRAGPLETWMRFAVSIVPLSLLIVSLSVLGPQAVSSAATAAGPAQDMAGVYRMPLINGDVVFITVRADGSTSYDVATRPLLEVDEQASATLMAGAVEARPSKVDATLMDVGYLVDEKYFLMDALPVILEASDTSWLPAVQRLVSGQGGEARVLSPELGLMAAKLPFATLVNGARDILEAGYVEKVWLDTVVRATLDTNVPRIGAPQVWDTGVDATHPDLDDLDDNPAAIDPKVLQSRDFTGEGDTRDARGHGTHVAGIAAGTGRSSGGTYIGTAPGANLWNLRVLDSGGLGLSSWIIAALEFASLGPDKLLGSDDEADVANLSLGGSPTGSGNDPLSLAVDLAVGRGLVVVVAAGNEGPEMLTVTRPGVARKAITVGATDDLDNIASFSGRGPTSDLRLKPDVVAPGSSIQSTARGDGYTTLSGTSMATPHVAGAAALILHAHPDWDPAKVKAALMNHALPLEGRLLWEQGAGRIRLPESVGATLLAMEPSINLGLMKSGDQAVHAMELVNLSAAAITVDLSTTTTVDGAATSDLVTVTPSSVEVPAGGSAQVLLQAGPVRRHAAGWYEGRVTGAYPGGSVTVPYLAQVEQSANVDITPSSIARTLGLFQEGNDILTVRNLGAGQMSFEVKLRDVEPVSDVSQGSSAPWVCVNPVQGELGPGESLDVAVSTNCLRDLGLGVHSAEIAVDSNDPVRPSVVIPVGVFVEVGPPPDIEISPTSFDVEVSVDQRLSAVLEVTNLDTGDAGGVLKYVFSDLEPIFVEDAAWLSQHPRSGLVDPGTSDEVAVVFDATGLSAGSYRSLILISSNDPDDPYTLLPVTMTVLAPDIGVSPGSFDLGTVDRDRLATTALDIQNTGAGTLYFNLDPQVPWLWPGTGEVPAGGTLRVVVTADSTGLAPGAHAGDILVRSNDPDDDPVAVRAQLTVLAPDIGVAPASFDLGTLDRDGCANRALTVANSGDGTLVFDISSAGLDLQAGSGEHRLPPATGSSVVQLSICTTGVDPGQHTFDIAVRSNDPDEPVLLVPVAVDVPAPWVEVSPVSLSATLDRDGDVRRNITITNSGDGTLAFEIEHGIPWLFPLTTGGHVPPGDTENVEFLIRALDRDPGTYGGTLVIRTNDPLRSTLLVPVLLTVLAPVIEVSSSSIAVALGGDKTITVDLTVTNSGEGTLAMQASASEASSPPPTPPPPVGGEAATQPPWLSVMPSQSSLRTGESATLEVSIDTTSLSDAGRYTGTVVIDSNDLQRTPTTIPVTLAFGGALVKGKVTLEGQSDHAGTTLIVSQGGATITSMETDSEGAFTIALEPGSYHVTARHRYHLPWHADIDVLALDTLEVAAKLLAGDWNGDGVIDIRDIIIAVKNLTRASSP